MSFRIFTPLRNKGRWNGVRNFVSMSSGSKAGGGGGKMRRPDLIKNYTPEYFQNVKEIPNSGRKVGIPKVKLESDELYYKRRYVTPILMGLTTSLFYGVYMSGKDQSPIILDTIEETMDCVFMEGKVMSDTLKMLSNGLNTNSMKIA